MGSFQWQNRCTRSVTTTTSKDSSAPPVCRKVTRRHRRRRRFQTWPSENLPSTSSFCRWSNQVFDLAGLLTKVHFEVKSLKLQTEVKNVVKDLGSMGT